MHASDAKDEALLKHCNSRGPHVARKTLLLLISRKAEHVNTIRRRTNLLATTALKLWTLAREGRGLILLKPLIYETKTRLRWRHFKELLFVEHCPVEVEVVFLIHGDSRLLLHVLALGVLPMCALCARQPRRRRDVVLAQAA